MLKNNDVSVCRFRPFSTSAQTAARCTFLNGAASFPILVINVIKKDGTICN